MKNRMLLFIVLTTISFSVFAQKDLDRLINESRKAINKGHYEKGLSLCDAAYQIDSTDYRIYLYRGIAYYSRSEAKLALEELFKAKAYINFKPCIAYYTGLAYYELQDYNNAILYLRTLQESNPEYLDFNIDLADAYLEQGSDSCLYYFDKVLSKKPKYAYAYQRKGDFYLFQDRFQECLLYYSQAIRFNKRDTHSYYLRSYAKYMLADYQGAERDVQKVYETGKPDTENYLYLGIYRYWTDNSVEAKLAFTKSIALDSTNWESLYYLAEIQYYEDEYDEALSNINKAIKLKKDDSDLFVLRGNINFEISDPGIACADWMIAGGMGSEEARDLIEVYCEEDLAEQ